MATTTFYTGEIYNGYDNHFYRAKCVYTTTETATNFSVSMTTTLQLKGTYENGNDTSYLDYRGARVGHVTQNAYNFSDASTNMITTISSSSWRDTTVSLKKSFVINKGVSSQTLKIIAYVSNSIYSGGYGGANDYNHNEVSKTLTIPALASYTVSYNANGGIGAPSSSIKYYDKDLYLSSTKPQKTDYIFYHWNTNINNTGTSYEPYGTYTANASAVLYAIWNPKISYNTNGGLNTPASQTKTYDVDLQLTNAVPIRSGYVFDGWNTESDGSGTSYSSGDLFSSNVATTLYAQWLSLPEKPKINSLTALRCDQNGEPDDSGSYGLVTVNWSVDTTSTAYPNNSGTVTGTIRPQSSSTKTAFTLTGDTTGSGGTATGIVSNLDTDMQYYIEITITDDNSSSSKTVIITRAFFIMDFYRGGTGIGIGRAAPSEGLEVGYKSYFDDDVTFYGKTILGGNPTTNLEAVPKQYLDTYMDIYAKTPFVAKENEISGGTGDGFEKNFLNISTTNPYSSIHQRWSWSFVRGGYNSYTNIPPFISSYTTAEGYREVYWSSATNIIIKVVANSPFYVEMYNIYSGLDSLGDPIWSGWKTMHSMYGEELEDGTDLNDIVIAGTYRCVNDRTYSNIPANHTYGLLVVEKYDPSAMTHIVQRFYVGSYQYRRFYINNAWGNWSTDMRCTSPDMFPTVQNQTGTNQHWGIWCTLTNANNPTYSGHRTGLMVYNSTLKCYDNDTSSTLWDAITTATAHTTTTTISNIITASSDATISSAQYAQWGKIAQINITWKNKNAITVPASGNITNIQVGTLVSGKRPAIISSGWSKGDDAGAAWYNISTAGVIELGACEGYGTASRTISADSTFVIRATYIL